MMIDDVFNSVDAVFISIFITLLVSVVATSALIFAWRARQSVHALQQQLGKLQKDLRTVQGSMIGIGQQLIYLEKQKLQAPSDISQAFDFQLSTDSSDESEKKKTVIDAQPTGDSVYDRARQSLAEGIPIADIARECQLSYAEVSLLHSLSQNNVDHRPLP